MVCSPRGCVVNEGVARVRVQRRVRGRRRGSELAETPVPATDHVLIQCSKEAIGCKYVLGTGGRNRPCLASSRVATACTAQRGLVRRPADPHGAVTPLDRRRAADLRNLALDIATTVKADAQRGSPDSAVC